MKIVLNCLQIQQVMIVHRMKILIRKERGNKEETEPLLIGYIIR